MEMERREKGKEGRRERRSRASVAVRTTVPSGLRVWESS